MARSSSDGVDVDVDVDFDVVDCRCYDCLRDLPLISQYLNINPSKRLLIGKILLVVASKPFLRQASGR